MKRITTLTKIICPLDCKYGAPMGRCNVGKLGLANGRIYDKAVPMGKDSGYDKGGAYWGIGAQLRVRFTEDMSYIEFYRLGDNMPPLPEYKPKTLVDFRMEDGKPLAVFPQRNFNDMIFPEGNKICYGFIGQHSNCHVSYYKALPKATPEQYADLKRELESEPYNYNLKVCGEKKNEVMESEHFHLISMAKAYAIKARRNGYSAKVKITGTPHDGYGADVELTAK